MSMAKELYDVAYNLHFGKSKVSEDKAQNQLIAFLIYHFIIDNYSRITRVCQ